VHPELSGTKALEELNKCRSPMQKKLEMHTLIVKARMMQAKSKKEVKVSW
jgi:hypothetical protein